MTQAEVNAFEARHAANRRKGEGRTDIEGCLVESELHEKIFAECRRRSWIALHGAMSERTHRTAGEPDFVIMGNYGSSASSFVLFVECKTRTGKLSKEQSAMIYHAFTLGHTIHVVRSFDEFLKLL